MSGRIDGVATFLCARLDETEAEARKASDEYWRALALRNVEAGRARLERYRRATNGDLPEWKAGRELIEAGVAVLLGAIRDDASVYSGHPDYRPEWAA